MRGFEQLDKLKFGKMSLRCGQAANLGLRFCQIAHFRMVEFVENQRKVASGIDFFDPLVYIIK